MPAVLLVYFQAGYIAEIRTPFLGGRTLIVHRKGPVALWSSAAQGLELADRSGRRERILRLEQLRGRVLIRSARDALAFVRLRTCPLTTGSLNSPEYEVVSQDRFTAELCYNDRETYAYLAKATGGLLGIGRRSQVLSQNMMPAASLKLRDRYVIRRWIITGIEHHITAKFVRETVWPDGRFKRKVLEKKAIVGYGYIPAGE